MIELLSEHNESLNERFKSEQKCNGVKNKKDNEYGKLDFALGFFIL